MTVLTNLANKKDIRRKKNVADNHFDNILRFFDVLPNFLFTTSETMHN